MLAFIPSMQFQTSLGLQGHATEDQLSSDITGTLDILVQEALLNSIHAFRNQVAAPRDLILESLVHDVLLRSTSDSPSDLQSLPWSSHTSNSSNMNGQAPSSHATGAASTVLDSITRNGARGSPDADPAQAVASIYSVGALTTASSSGRLMGPASRPSETSCCTYLRIGTAGRYALSARRAHSISFAVVRHASSAPTRKST